ncbi:glycosyltransferase [Pseudoclavibacter sp. RFBA6]|uniref:glycosyltransferase n=1 Tax=Pseudoclavibacter sp. RFBA6 TaxID=2080573 RepID=UPI0011B032D0|nr:glycosyltransferase [Pseudoclavibacter sp. RFBA6]
MHTFTLGGAVPYPGVRHAGGVYLERLTQELLSRGSVTLAAPDHPANLEALDSADPRLDVRLIGRWADGQSTPQRLLARALGVGDRLLRRFDPTLPPLTFVAAVYFDRAFRDELRRADCIDLQWFEFIRLAPHIRRVAKNARINGTFHDVLSQLYTRNAETRPSEAARWQRAASTAARNERHSLRTLDTVLTLNAKDASLLRERGAEQVVVVNPPLAPRTPTTITPLPTPTAPRVVFLAYFGRAFNVEAAEWFVREVWPLVRSETPDATVELVGADPEGRLDPLLDEAKGVSASGFVDDLAAAYGRASVVVVPLRSGSGVKFKTIEAITHGVPTVTTSVGAEGVVAADRIEAVVDDAPGFARATAAALRHPIEARGRARELAAAVSDEFGPAQFSTTITEVYPVTRPSIDREHASVVLPYYGDPADTLALIDRLREQEGVAEIIVADDASPIAFPATEGVTVVRRAQNGGFGAAVNTGADKATTDLILVLNSDLEIGDTFVRELLDAAAPLQPAVVSPQVVKPSGEPEWTARRFPRVRHHVVEWLSPLARWRHLPFMHRAVGHVTDLAEDGVDRADWVIGAALLIPVAEFRQVGGFDERYHMTSEEVDLQLRLARVGVNSFVANPVRVTHVGGGSSDSSKRRQWLVTARQRYAVKWGGDATLSSALAVASIANFVVNASRQLAGRDIDAKATLNYELGLLRTARAQSRATEPTA